MISLSLASLIVPLILGFQWKFLKGQNNDNNDNKEVELGLRMPPVSTIHNIICNCDSHRNYSTAMFDKSVRTGTWGHPKVLNHVEAGPKFDSDSPGTDFSEQSVFEYAGVSRSRYVQILVSKLVEYGRIYIYLN
ncbi:hypothetical protein P167DRAFT_563727 [Morchella conica CCBAS932]|uniref:Uncharacterized protein n=1 Tax=Morchella conica CCBAS932 TaxID=1392247 RepID=A0A3N4L238_9PEZI|nr:hypothetical protein P167DRAFT_563727 [Morchella conica CCBAS932]